MGCSFEVLLPAGFSGGIEAAEAALDEVGRLDRTLSIYRPDSEVSRLNAAAGLGPRPASESVIDLLALCQRLADETEGSVDPAVGALVRAWGFDAGERMVPSDEGLARALELTGMSNVRFDPDAGTVNLLHPGVELNFGAIGKGYALDRAAAVLHDQWQVPSALVHGGKSSIYAIGTSPGETDGWMIGIRDPGVDTGCIGAVWLRNQGLATSGGVHRFFEANGKRCVHVLDPRTGRPAEGMCSVTVVAPTAAEADALSTAFFIMGSRFAARYAACRQGIGVVLFPETESTLVAHLVGDLKAEFAPEVHVERITETTA
jgi:thiamine biosynthesis lipoprotein